MSLFNLFKKKKTEIIFEKVEKAEIENDQVITFEDINLEVYIRKTIEKETGDIFKSDVYNIKKLNFKGWPLISIRGIHCDRIW